MIRDISIVIPIYNEQDNIIQLIKEVRASLEKKINYEIIIVDDGSDDNTYAVSYTNLTLPTTHCV